MAGRRGNQRKSEEEHTYLSIRVERYHAEVEAAVNHTVYAPQYVWDIDGDEPLYRSATRLTVCGVSTYPKERAGHEYELTLLSDNTRSRRLSVSLKDAQVLSLIHI